MARARLDASALTHIRTLAPEQSALKLQVGDLVRLTADECERVAEAVVAELESNYL